MNSAIPSIPRSIKAIRAIIYFNFFLVGLFVVPVTHRLVDRLLRALQPIKLEDPIGWSLQVWIVGSTVLATSLYVREAFRGKKIANFKGPRKSFNFDGVLLLAWWLTVLCFMVYGFVLGTGG